MIATGVILVAALWVLGLIALAQHGGTSSATGPIRSLTPVPTGVRVCVEEATKPGHVVCGELENSQLPDHLHALVTGDCAYIKAARGAAIDLEPRGCP